MNCKIKISQREEYKKLPNCKFENIFVSGERISNQEDYVSGINTYSIATECEDNPANRGIYSSVVGEKCILNKLMYVKCANSVYTGNVGDTVVGRILEVHKNRWKVDTGSCRTSILNLTNVKLPGGETRRRSEEDEKAMRLYLDEGDLLVAEVKEMQNNIMMLMVRDHGQGKLGQGMLLRVPCSAIVAHKQYTHALTCDITMILGCNGMVWLGPSRLHSLTYQLDKRPLTYEETERMIRVANSIKLLVARAVPLSDDTVCFVYEHSIAVGLESSELLHPHIQASVASRTMVHINMPLD